ncbi:MAG: malectin domain-containing carbohydrate-binding protein [Cyclobacteriaceae bacterium]
MKSFTLIRFVFAITIFSLASSSIAQNSVSFSSSTLTGVSLDNPTSLQFGPDNRLYVSQQNGWIYAFTIQRSGADNYQASAVETIGLIRNIPNHNDDGTLNTSVKDRQVTGILLTGTASQPILYVSSSDPRIGGGGTGGDKNLDTNSGVISKLVWSGTSWQKTDIVTGLPRSEENHAVNGMQLDEVNQILYLAVGGHTNAGAPSNNFAFLTEYALSAAILKIDLKRIDEEFNGLYKLPTLDDPTRPNQADGSDLNDPWGGNDGLNQAKIVEGGPVQIHSPGYRNAYDLVLTKTPGRENRLYTIDNGANGGWGGHPDKEGASGNPLTTSVTNNYVIGEPGSTGPGPNDAKVNNLDNLHLVSMPGMAPVYGGHPAPVRANPSGAGLYRFNNITGSATFEMKPTVDWPPIPPQLANPVEGDFRNPGVNDGALYTWIESTNGMTEYTSDAYFGGALKGDLLTASYDGVIYRIKLSTDGRSVEFVEPLASGFGSIPLDVTAQGPGSLFEGTIWAATYGSDAITVFEPSGSWQPEISADGSLPTARHEAGFIEVSGKIFLIGGRETAAVDVYDPVTKNWSAGGIAPIKMHHFQPVVWNGKIYVLGAYQGTFSTGNLNNSESPVPDIYIYDPAKKSWTKGPAIPRPRGSAAVVVYNNEFYMLGGIINGHQDGWVKWADKFNPVTGIWTQLPDLPRERDHFQAGLINGKIYLAGGRKTNATGNVYGVTIEEIDVFDPVSKSSSTLPLNANLPVMRAGTMTVVANEELFIIGGEAETQKPSYNLVQSFNPKTNSWRNHANMSVGRHGTGAVLLNKRIFIASGATERGSVGVTSSMESLLIESGCSGNQNDFTADDDGDGYSNGDETLNGTNYCSKASQPTDADQDFLSDRLDSDDDNDGIADKNDLFVLDSSNGMTKQLPVSYPFLNGEPGTGFFGLGFTGLMSDGKKDYLEYFDPSDPDLIMGGAVGIANIPAVSGDAVTNDQKYAFQFGFNPGTSQGIVTVKSQMQGPFFGGAYGSLLVRQSQGIFIGKGDQDNYLKLVLYANQGQPGFRILGEEKGVIFIDRIISIPDILNAGSITLLLSVDYSKSLVNCSYMLPGGTIPITLGEPILISKELLTMISGTAATATGIIASLGSDGRFSAAWDYMEVRASGVPQLNAGIPGQYLMVQGENNNKFSLDLSRIYDQSSGSLTYKNVQVNSDNLITSSEISGSVLNLYAASGKAGTASVTVRGYNETGLYADYTFTLKIISPLSTIKLINSGGAAFELWSGDMNFSGGKLYATTINIINTLEDKVYQTERYGSLFNYSIPVSASGYFQVRLHFAEIYHGIKNKLGTGARIMDVEVENRLALDNFDIFSAAGGAAKAVVMTIDSVLVTDGKIDLKFIAVKDQAKISGIQILAYSDQEITNRPPLVVNPGKQYFFEGTDAFIRIPATDPDALDKLTFTVTGLPASLKIDALTGIISGPLEADLGVYPVTVNVSDNRGGNSSIAFDIEVSDPMTYRLRINAGGTEKSNSDQLWKADNFFTGGSVYTKSLAINNTDLDVIYQTERYGRFGYQIPVPGQARYRINLLFAEKYFQTPDARLFNIIFESGGMTRTGLDVFATAGSAFSAYEEQFAIDVSDGFLDIFFEPLKNNAMVSGIEISTCVQPLIGELSVSSSTVCAGQQVRILINGSLNSGDKWVLYKNICGGIPVASGTDTFFDVTADQTTQYFVRAEGECVISADCNSVQVSVEEVPVITSFKVSEPSLCNEQTVTLTLEGRLGAAAGWNLFEGKMEGAPVASNTTGIFQVNPKSTKNYIVAPEGQCATAEMAQTVTVEVMPLPEIKTFYSDKTEICEGEEILLTVNGIKGINQIWSLFEEGCNGSLVATSETGLFRVKPSRTTTYFVRINSDCEVETNCLSTKISVDTNPEIFSLAVSPSGICPGTQNTITINGTPGISGIWNLYEGSCGGNLVASGSEGFFEVAPEKTTIYFVAPAGRCNMSDNCESVIIFRVPINTQIFQDAGVLSAEETNAQFQWFDCTSGLPVAGASDASFSPARSGEYKLRIQKDGCEAFTECIDFIVASASKEKNKPHLFPNPVGDFLRVVLTPEMESAVVTVSDVSGREFISEKSASDSNLILLKTDWLPAGIYVVRVHSSPNVYTTKIIKN